MKKLNINMYGDKQFIAISDLRIAGYDAKKEIEGEAKKVLEMSIALNGVKSPIIINTYPGREGYIINGVEVYKISKSLGIYEVPFFDLCVPEPEEKEFHYLFSVKLREYSIEDIITQLKSPYESYFKAIDIPLVAHDEIFDYAEDMFIEKLPELQNRKFTFALRLDEVYKSFPSRLQELMGTKSQNEAITKLLIDAVEGRIGI